MRSICDILVFNTPFEDENKLKDKFKKIKEMFEDYVVNAGIPLEKNIKDNGSYQKIEFVNIDFNINISFSFKLDLYKKDYFPAIIVSYNLDEFKFNKANIENFLNDNIKFIYNVFFDDFFIDYDKKFELNDVNKGKKVELKDLKNFDLENPKSDKNKQILDSMMYTYFNLIKNIFNIDSNSDEINKIITDNSSFEANLTLFTTKQDEIKKLLAVNADNLKQQIDTFVNLIS